MAGINNLTPLYFDRGVFDQFQSIANDEAVGNNTVLQLGKNGVVTTGGDFIGNIARFQETQKRNNFVRSTFLDTVKGLYGVKSVNNLPPAVKDALELHNFNVDKNEESTTGRPLSARRVRAVLQAIKEERDLASFKMSDDKARCAELVKDLDSIAVTIARKDTVSIPQSTFNDRINELSEKIATHLTASIQTFESPQPGGLKKMRDAKALQTLQTLLRTTMCRLLDSKLVFFNRDFARGDLPREVKLGCAACLLALAKARARVRKDVLLEKNVKLIEERVAIFEVQTNRQIVEASDREFMKVVDDLVSRLVKLRGYLGDNYVDGSEQGGEVERILDDLQKSLMKEPGQAAVEDDLEKKAQKPEQDQQMQAALKAADEKHGASVAKARADLLDLEDEYDLKLGLYSNALTQSQSVQNLVRTAVDALPSAQKKANASWMSALSRHLVCSQLKKIAEFASKDTSDVGAVKGVACLLALKYALLAADPANAKHGTSTLELMQRIVGSKTGSTACCEPRYQAVAKEQMALLKELNLDDGKAATEFLDKLWTTMDEQALKL